MPGKHHTQGGHSTQFYIIAACAACVILVGIAAAGFLFSDRLSQKEPQPSLTPSPTKGSFPAAAPVSTPQATPTPEPSPTPGPIPDNGQDGYLSEGIYIWNDMAFELFYGYNDAAEPYAQAIESFAQRLPSARVYNMVVPNHCEFGLPERLRDNLGCGSQRENTAYIYDSYSAVTPVDIYDAFDQHKQEYLYFNTDTHWAGLGAYYAYEEFCQVAELSPSPLESFTVSSYEDFHGYLYQISGEDCLLNNSDRIDLYEPGFRYTAELSEDGYSFTELSGINSSDPDRGYSMFMWGDQPCMRVVNNSSFTGRKLALVKESYGNAIGPFLAASFDELYVIDFRSFAGSLPELVDTHGITDVLFLNSTIAANTYQRVEELYTLFP